MDKKKKMMKRTFVKRLWMLWMSVTFVLPLVAQSVERVAFYGDSINKKKGEITLFIKLLDADGKGTTPGLDIIRKRLKVFEAKTLIDWNNARIERASGKRISADYTFSILIDQNIPQEGLDQIYDNLRVLLESAPDGCVYVSFFGGNVTSTEVMTTSNYQSFKDKFDNQSQPKRLYDALYCKLAEFSNKDAKLLKDAHKGEDYTINHVIAERTLKHPEKNVMLVFTECETDFDLENITFIDVIDFNHSIDSVGPRIFSFYYKSSSEPNEDALQTLRLLANHDGMPQERVGKVFESDDFNQLIQDLGETIGDQMYDYAFTYKAFEKVYAGDTDFEASWDDKDAGKETLAIASKEDPWIVKHHWTWYEIVILILGAILVTLLTIALYILLMKAIIPWVKSKTFAAKYYKKYVPEANVQRRVCHYCKQDLQPGQVIVTKCKHYMHIHCWKINNYKCAEYGQNCNEGIQEHVEWNSLFTKRTLQDSKLTIAGVIAALAAWGIYVLTGNGDWLDSLSRYIVNTFYKVHEHGVDLTNLCISKVSSFMAIGLLLGFFLSLVFRYYDEYRSKDWKILLKIFGLSLLSGVIGMAAFAMGGCIYCALISHLHTAKDLWYCSLPAYLLFSVCAALSLTIKSSVPVKSALLGGLCSAVIGFLVLRLSPSSERFPWLPMLLNFIIYGGGLGASLVTVRALAEKYFLVIQNGIKAGQRIPIHKWMNATGGGNKVTIGMTGDCEIQMNWEKSNKVAKEHAQLYIDQSRSMPVIHPLANGVVYNNRAELPVGKPSALTNGDTFKIGDTIFKYEETD